MSVTCWVAVRLGVAVGQGVNVGLGVWVGTVVGWTVKVGVGVGAAPVALHASNVTSITIATHTNAKRLFFIAPPGINRFDPITIKLYGRSQPGTTEKQAWFSGQRAALFVP
jgi:hypothetical protein